MKKNTLKSEAEAMLDEVLGGKKKPTLKKESNENLTTFNLKKLSVAQLEQALENGGFTDIQMKSAKFKQAKVWRNVLQFHYVISFENEEDGEGDIFVTLEADGFITAVF